MRATGRPRPSIEDAAFTTDPDEPLDDISLAGLRQQTVSSAVFNLVSTCLGSGMLALPATLAKLGLAGGLFMLVLVPWLGERTTALMVVATELTGGETYTVVAERTLGRAGSVVTAAAPAGGHVLKKIVVLMNSLLYPGHNTQTAEH